MVSKALQWANSPTGRKVIQGAVAIAAEKYSEGRTAKKKGKKRRKKKSGVVKRHKT